MVKALIVLSAESAVVVRVGFINSRHDAVQSRTRCLQHTALGGLHSLRMIRTAEFLLQLLCWLPS